MAKKIINIQVGNLWTKVALVDEGKKVPQVYSTFVFRTPEHSVEDGYIRDKETFLHCLKEHLAYRNIVEKNIIFTIGCSRVITREVTIPFVKKNKIESIVTAQSKEFFPMDVSNYVVSYQNLGTVEDDGTKKLKLLLIAVPDNLLANYTAFAQAGGYAIQKFDYVGNSAVSTVSNRTFDEKCIIVSMEEQTTIVSLIDGDELLFQRVAPYGYTQVLSTVQDQLILNINNDEDAFKFLSTHDTLYKAARAAEFRDNYEGSDENLREQLTDAYHTIRDSISYYVRVVGTALDYYKNQNKEVFNGRIFLCGDGACFLGIDQLFQLEFQMNQQSKGFLSSNNFQFVNLPGEEYEWNEDLVQKQVVAVIGAAVSPLDIMPREMRESQSKKNTLQMAYVALFASIAISVLLIVASVARLMIATISTATLTAQLANLAYVEEEYAQHDAMQTTCTNYEIYDNDTWTDNEMFSSFIAQLERELPKEVVVTSLSISDSTITMSMESDTKLTTAQMLMNFDNIDCVTDWQIASVSEFEDATGDTGWTYSISGTYIIPEVVEE